MGDYPANPGPLPVLRLRDAASGGDGPLVKGDNREDLVKQLQKMLIELGFYNGNSDGEGQGADGDFDDNTESGLRQFQSKNKDWNGRELKINGEVDEETSDSLNRALVGIWYDTYQTPLELCKKSLLIHTVGEALKDSFQFEVGEAPGVKIVAVKPIPRPPRPSYADPNMWATAGDDVENSHGGKVKYNPVDGNCVQWLQDGGAAMYEMCDAFCRATKFIWIIDAYFSPGINLARGEYYDRIRQDHPGIIKGIPTFNPPGVAGNKILLTSLLALKASEGVNVRIILFRPDWAQNLAGGPFGWEEAWDIVRKASDEINLQLAMWGLTYEGHELGAHHQKSAIVAIGDQLVAFCGGVDLAYARWQRPTHSQSDPIDIPAKIDDSVKIEPQMGWIDPSNVLGEWDSGKKEYASKGSQVFWHDVHAKIVGGAAADLADNFMERYKKADSSEYHSIAPDEDDSTVLKKPDMDKEPDFVWLKQNYENLKTAPAPASLIKSKESYAGERVRAQVLRSYYPADDYGIWDAYRNLIKKAKKNIYVESQYAFEDANYGILDTSLLKGLGTNGCFETLRDALKASKDLKVITVAPVMPDSYDKDILKNLRQLVKASTSRDDPQDYATARVTAYSLVSEISSGGHRRRVPVYVHAKIAIVDDEWAIVGSANLDRMGMGGKGGGWLSRGSSELAILVRSQEHALALRRILVKEHLGLNTPKDIDNFEEVFSSFKRAAARNGKPRDPGSPKSQIVYHRLYKDM